MISPTDSEVVALAYPPCVERHALEAATLLGRLRRARWFNENLQPEMNRRGRRFVRRSLAAAWDDCIQAGLAGPALVVLGIGETG